jgi:hypothetical protein
VVLLSLSSISQRILKTCLNIFACPKLKAVRNSGRRLLEAAPSDVSLDGTDKVIRPDMCDDTMKPDGSNYSFSRQDRSTGIVLTLLLFSCDEGCGANEHDQVENGDPNECRWR